MVQHHLVNIFEGTDPNESVLGHVFEYDEEENVHGKRKHSKQLKKTLAENLTSPEIEKHNFYSLVPEIPEHTDVSDDFLSVIILNALMTSPDFETILNKVKERDPFIMAYIITPGEMTATQSSFNSNSKYNSKTITPNEL